VAAVVLVVGGTVAGALGVVHSNSGTDQAASGPVTSTVGESTLTLSARTLSGLPPTDQALHAATAILMRRMAPFKITSTLRVEGQTLLVTVPTEDVSTVESLTRVASLRFRQVLEYGSYSPSGSATSGSSPDSGSPPLPGSEAPSLTPALLDTFNEWDCAKNPNPTGGSDQPGDYIVACDDPSMATSQKYLLAPAALQGSDIRSAVPGLDTSGSSWVVNVQFTHGGAAKWQAITKKTYEVDGGQPSTSCRPPTGCNGIGITLDGQVESAPFTETDGIPGGLTQISGTFTQRQAAVLANSVEYGTLPVRLTVSSVAARSGH
jgi:preprotein translocase subunit SecD